MPSFTTERDELVAAWQQKATDFMETYEMVSEYQQSPEAAAASFETSMRYHEAAERLKRCVSAEMVRNVIIFPYQYIYNSTHAVMRADVEFWHGPHCQRLCAVISTLNDIVEQASSFVGHCALVGFV